MYLFFKKYEAIRLLLLDITWIAVLSFSAPAWGGPHSSPRQQISLQKAKEMASRITSQQDIPIVVDESVLFWLNKAVGSGKTKKDMRDSLNRMKKYKEMIQAKLKNADLPQELMAVPLVESGYRNSVESPMKALGIWQFIPNTAKRCGLTVEEHLDERLDPRRLTDAAVCYYAILYSMFRDWHVVISAYNAGEGRMSQAISEATHNDVFKIARDGYLGGEGRDYLPKVMAAMIILKNPSLVEKESPSINDILESQL